MKKQVEAILFLSKGPERFPLLKEKLAPDFSLEQIPVGLEIKDVSGDTFAAIMVDLSDPSVLNVLKEAKGNSSLASLIIFAIEKEGDSKVLEEALASGVTDCFPLEEKPELVKIRIKGFICAKKKKALEDENEKLKQSLVEEKKIIEENSIDLLTKLPSRDGFYLKMISQIQSGGEETQTVGVFDVDNFKLFNDIYGPGNGDRLLAIWGKRLRDVDDGGCALGHITADRFAFCAPKWKIMPQKFVDMMIDAAKAAFPDFLFVGRLGLYEVPKGDIEAASILDKALLAGRSLKGDYSRHFCYYDKTMREKLVKEQALISRFEKSIKEKRFFPYYQIQVDLLSGKIIGAEALARMKDEEGNIVSPSEFIPLFEANGLIATLDALMLESICQDMVAWKKSYLAIPPMSINLSRKELYNSSFPADIKKVINSYNLDTRLFRFEITESAYMENTEQLLFAIAALKKEGFVIEMDDFGSGYSSLNSLREMPVDILKLDLLFLRSATDSPKGKIILSDTIRLAADLHLPLIAEGVETEEQATFLKNLGCRYVQGYLYSHPEPEDEFRKRLPDAIKK